jgi:3',5'-cyclic-AMP phosphodiesterase
MSQLVALSDGPSARKVLVMTDIHIRSEGQKIIQLDPLEKFEMALCHALALHKDADCLILTGDLAHSGKVIEYQRLNNALQLARNAGVAVHLMIGNHDNRENFLQVFRDTPVTSSGHIQQVVDIGSTHRFILLDTLDGPPFSHDKNWGILCPERITWLTEQLDHAERDEKAVIVLLHHPPFELGTPGMDLIRLQNGNELMDILVQYKSVQQIICGHIHRTISGNIRGKAFAIFKSPCHQLPLDLKSTDCSLSTPEPGAYGILLLKSDSIVVHTEDFELADIGKDFSCKDAIPEWQINTDNIN